MGMDHGDEATCEPVGEDLEAASEVRVSLGEYVVTPEVETVDAGTVKFVVENEGGFAHELAIAKGAPEDLPKAEDGSVDDAAIPAGDFLGEIEPFPAQSECEGTFELTAGEYTLFCNIVEEVGGKETSHFAEGMATGLTVG
jgi:plastocyanin